jgi:hypothetical protein
MRHAKGIGRLGGLAVGLGIGAAMAATPGVASADPLPPFDPTNFAISFDGFTLFQTGTATATSGMGDFAIADGAGSLAVAEGGFGDFAFTNGAGTVAVAGDGAANATGNNFDFASVDGTSSTAEAGFGGSFDSAAVVGNDSAARASFGIDNVPANFGNFDSASVVGDHSLAQAVFGSNDLAFVSDPGGSLGSTAVAGGEIFGLPGNFDLGGAFGDGLLSNGASGGSFLVDILPFF